MLNECATRLRRRITAAAAGLLLAALAAAAPLRPIVSLDQDWRFHLGDAPGAAQLAAAPAGWAPVALPHTWNAQDGADGGNDYVRGTGWYLRRFAPEAAWRGRRIFLQFDGANRRAEVFLNGRRLGEHIGGYARFRFDITDAVQWRGGNLLAVRVSNAADGTPPISADFTFFGGLYRGVTLFATDPVHLDTLDFASDGVYLAQDHVSAERADLTATVRLRNDTGQPVRATVRVELADAAGNNVAALERAAPVAAAGGATSELKFSVARPHLWNGRQDPYLHTARISVWVDGRLRDAVTQRIGLRSFRIDPAQGFFLNGAPLDLHGVSRHQDRAGKGWALGAADEREDFSFVRELGATALRVAHYPQSDLWFDLADENGLVVWAEIPVVNEVPATPAYAENAKQQLRELIRQHFNRPGICFWGIGNETREAGDAPGRETPDAPTADRLIAALNDLAHEEDHTRLTTYASHHRGDDVRNFHTDVMAFNKYFGWYGGKADDLGSWLDQVHAKHPALRIGLSEYGAGANIAQHAVAPPPPKPGGPWHPEEYQAWFHERQWAVLAARPYVWGKFVWNLFDFACDSRAEGGAPGLNDKGLVTYDRRTRKDAFYFYKANWSAEPVLHIASRRFTERTVAEIEVKIYSNAPAVELFLNGASCGATTSSDRIFRWTVRLAEGENRMVARAQTAGGEITDECVWKLVRPPGNT
jgi:beta-galactosidase